MTTYIAHYLPLQDRKELLEPSLKINGFQSIKWVTEEPPADFHALNGNSQELWGYRDHLLNYGSHTPSRRLLEAEISLLYKHYLILKCVADGEEEFGLVLEDDVLFCEGFRALFDFNISHTPPDWDFIFMGSACNLRIPAHERQEGQVAYIKSHPASKCTDSFLVKKSAARKILKTFFPFVFPADFELNFQMFAHDLRVYWWEPPLIRQGSHTGLFKGTIT